jgi:hypothetical protein
MEELVKLIQAEYTRDDIPEFKAGVAQLARAADL